MLVLTFQVMHNIWDITLNTAEKSLDKNFNIYIAFTCFFLQPALSVAYWPCYLCNDHSIVTGINTNGGVDTTQTTSTHKYFNACSYQELPGSCRLL